VPTRRPRPSIRRDDVCAAVSRGFWRVGGQDLLRAILTGLVVGCGMGEGDGLQEHWFESNVSPSCFGCVGPDEGSSRNSHTRCCVIVARIGNGREAGIVWNYGCFMASPSAAHSWVRGWRRGSAAGSSAVVVVARQMDVAAAVQDVTSCPERPSRNDAAGCYGGTGLQGCWISGPAKPAPPHHWSSPFKAFKEAAGNGFSQLLAKRKELE
jgi:hypothetical protein